MENIWDKLFSGEEPVWGLEPSDSAYYALKLFQSSDIKNILIPGVGYGRNAKLFTENGFEVTGIEISGNAIKQARKLGFTFPIHLGSVCDMPYDTNIFSGVFCYAVLHLLNRNERKKFLNDCYQQLAPGGLMIFTIVSLDNEKPGTEKTISANRYIFENGLKVYFYNEESIVKEFKKLGLINFEKIDEPIKFKPEEKPIKSFIITCKKP